MKSIAENGASDSRCINPLALDSASSANSTLKLERPFAHLNCTFVSSQAGSAACDSRKSGTSSARNAINVTVAGTDCPVVGEALTDSTV